MSFIMHILISIIFFVASYSLNVSESILFLTFCFKNNQTPVPVISLPGPHGLNFPVPAGNRS
jgi:hypothetical protein